MHYQQEQTYHAEGVPLNRMSFVWGRSRIGGSLIRQMPSNLFCMVYVEAMDRYTTTRVILFPGDGLEYNQKMPC